ncbi:DUF1206 domain-containing protein [Microvirga sp. GCM10011540]|uniref:DUF1206 domain-containing protein n=1 Tax=Microvirga sp. GCM10011540 TaxID=3317338 RepID=UPI003609E624
MNRVMLVTTAARVGYGARGVLYLIIGGLAVLAALDLGGDLVGTRGALRVLFAQPAGYLLIGAVAGGFACLAVWRLIQAWADPSGYGRDLKGLSIRAVLGASALVHGAIAVSAVRLMLGWEIAALAHPGSAFAAWFASILSAPLGPWIAGATGVAVVGAGVIKIVKAWRAEFDDHLECGDWIRHWAIPISRFGLTARGVVFVLIGASICLAAYQLKANRANGLAGVLQWLEQTPYGWILLAAVALGLAAFGVFGLIEAMYRRIGAQDID